MNVVAGPVMNAVTIEQNANVVLKIGLNSRILIRKHFTWEGKNMHDNNDKINSINRCFFDAEHGWVTLALERIRDLSNEFPDDPQVEYAEALIRKDFLGQGLKAQELFLKAHYHSKDRRKSNENYLFSTFNSAKYARNETEFFERVEIARSLAPDDHDLKFFDSIRELLRNGNSYGRILMDAVAGYQSEKQHGDCASFAELALLAEEHNVDDELELRKARMSSLRELDKAAEASRNTRGEGFPPQERLALQQALIEMDRALILDPADHMLWNFKGAWLYLLDQQENAIAALDKSVSLCPVRYPKPLTNKALSLQRLGRKDEAKIIAERALSEAEEIGDEGKGDIELAHRILNSLEEKTPSDDQMLNFLAERIITSVQLTARQEMAQWKGSSEGKALLQGLKHRVTIIGKRWSNSYIKIMEELLYDFCSETAYITVMRLSDSNQEAYQHCLHAAIYLAAHSKGIMQRDACRFLIYVILGAGETNLVKKVYREAILGPTNVGKGKFTDLDKNMRSEISKFNPALLKLFAEQTPLNHQEIDWARKITIARFIDGVSRDPVIKKKSIFRNLLSKLLNKN